MIPRYFYIAALAMTTFFCISAKNMPSFSREIVSEIGQNNNPTIEKLQQKIQQEQQNKQAQAGTRAGTLITYQPKDYSHLLGMAGFSDKALNQHFTLYQAYVKNTNEILQAVAQMTTPDQRKSQAWADLKRRLAWEFDGMRLHELYFGNLGGTKPLDPNSSFAQKLVSEWGSIDAWRQDFIDTGAMRGIGWAILYQDPVTGQLMNVWINEHDMGHIATGTPLLLMDVFEHAYMVDYGLDRAAYIKAFLNNVDWQVVQNRYDAVNARSSAQPSSYP